MIPDTVVVQCKDRAHEPQIEVIETFIAERDRSGAVVDIRVLASSALHGGVEVWRTAGARVHADADAERHRKDTNPVTRLNDDDRPVDNDFEARRTVYELRCRLCGIDVPARKEKMLPVVEKYLAIGEPYIELAALARRLGKQP